VDERTRTALEVALNEAEVVGLRRAASGPACELLLHVCAQPAADPRRVLRLLDTARIRVLLRESYGPAIPLADLDAVEAFFASLRGWESMYGWEFLDRPARTRDWPQELSLTVDLRPGPGAHSLYWFTECWMPGRDGLCIEGTVDFDDLEVTYADGAPEPVERFIAEGQRWWDALFGRNGHQPQVQRTSADARSWRGRRPNTTTVAG
jgi:hypothetical protein